LGCAPVEVAQRDQEWLACMLGKVVNSEHIHCEQKSLVAKFPLADQVRRCAHKPGASTGWPSASMRTQTWSFYWLTKCVDAHTNLELLLADQVRSCAHKQGCIRGMQTTTQGRPSDAQDPPVDQCVCVVPQLHDWHCSREVNCIWNAEWTRQCDGRQRMAVVATTRLKR
jgi:hypothetical protein